MERKNNKMMIVATIFATLLCVISIIWIVVQSYFISTGSGEGCIAWHEELYPLQWTIFTGRLIFKSLFYTLIIVFIVKQFKAIKSGVLFPAANVTVMYTMAISYLIGNICNDNIETALTNTSSAAFVINSDTLLYTALLVIFAIIYKIAVKVSEENNLTI